MATKPKTKTPNELGKELGVDARTHATHGQANASKNFAWIFKKSETPLMPAAAIQFANSWDTVMKYVHICAWRLVSNGEPDDLTSSGQFERLFRRS